MANVLDFKCDTYPEDLLKDIFKHQHELATKYIPIEKKNGLCLYDQIPGDIDNARAQARIKDMSWRAIEEVAEAFEALYNGEVIHFYEEMADAMHFLVEKYLLCNFLPVSSFTYSKCFFNDESEITILATHLDDFFDNHYPQIEEHMSNIRVEHLERDMAKFVVACGLSCNCLKNKPWKQSQMLTDVSKFNKLLFDEFKAFINLCKVTGFNEKSLYDMYIRKNQVNQFRQRSNY